MALTAPALAAPVPGQGTWQSTLQARDLNGDGTADAFYDTVLQVTWLANANAGAGSAFDSSAASTATDGRMTWNSAMAWAAGLNVFGTTGWRLPTLLDTRIRGCEATFGGTDCGYNVETISADGLTVYNELAHLFHVTLGNRSACDTTGNCSAGDAAVAPDFMLTNTGNFVGFQPSAYWQGTTYANAPNGGFAWFYYANLGYQNVYGNGGEFYALALRSGDVLQPTQDVPEPGTWALALLALALMVRGSLPFAPCPDPKRIAFIFGS